MVLHSKNFSSITASDLAPGEAAVVMSLSLPAQEQTSKLPASKPAAQTSASKKGIDVLSQFLSICTTENLEHYI